jgi:hypothetical protein
MIVVADASPLQYLVLIDEVQILCALYGRMSFSPSGREGADPTTDTEGGQWLDQ